MSRPEGAGFRRVAGQYFGGVPTQDSALVVHGARSSAAELLRGGGGVGNLRPTLWIVSRTPFGPRS